MPHPIQIEDALKHVHESGARGETPTVASLAGALGLPADEAAQLLAGMEEGGWIARADGRYQLTPAGRDRALHVIRAHRLYEAHLARETGLDAARWHQEAERREHELTPDDLASLAHRLGDPRFDPHGDPIPTPAGELPGLEGQPLLDCPEGQTGRVAHIEDEPEALYREILAAGLAPDMRLRVVGRDPAALRLNVEGEPARLSRAAAANVLVAPLAAGASFDDTVARLSALRPREQAEIVTLLPTCRGPERRRLLDLGVVPGTRVEIDLVSPGGDPTAYLIRGASIALRRSQAARILIRKRRP